MYVLYHFTGRNHWTAAYYGFESFEGGAGDVHGARDVSYWLVPGTYEGD